MMVVTSIPAVIPILNEAGPMFDDKHATQPIRIKEPIKVSDTVFLLKDKACNILDNGGCNAYRANGHAICFKSRAPLLV